MKIVFAGTPAFALPSLCALHAAGYEIAAALTQPDAPQGRKGVLTPPPVKVKAQELGIPVLQPARLRDEAELLRAVGAELMVTCAYGQLLTQEVLDLFPRGVWNVHASLLPAYRGAAPVARCIIDGAKKTGVTIMKTDIGMDTGDLFLRDECAVCEEDTCGTLTEKLAAIGARLIVAALDKIERGETELIKQGEGSVCKKVARTAVDFSRSAEEVARLIRGLSPAPLAYGTLGALTLNFYHAIAVPRAENAPCGTVLCDQPKEGLVVQCGEGAVKITTLQPTGGKILSARDFLNGRKVQKGQHFEKPVL